MSVTRKILTLLAFPAFLLGLPLIGIGISGQPVTDFLVFPPRPELIENRPFSWTVFAGMALFIVVVTGPFVKRHVQYWRSPHSFGRFDMKARNSQTSYPFPWWGWGGLMLLALSWLLAWTRFEWFAAYQEHTFSPLWISYVIVVNAVFYKRKGWSLMSHYPLFLVGLALTSAVFWWFFEYLNQFVNNWYYTEVANMKDTYYFLQATIPFATVLPAVLSTTLLLLSFPCFSRPFRFKRNFSALSSGYLWSFIGIVAAVSLSAIAIYPQILFPLIWVSPVILWITLQKWRHYTNPFLKRVQHGDWTFIWVSAMAALLCGFFWEMWNFYSLSQWIYSVPWVQTTHIFEMPLLGYAGYLPFGLECIVIADSLTKALDSKFDFNTILADQN